MREDLPSWVEDDTDESARRSSIGRPWIWALALLPWLVVLGLVVTGTTGTGAASTPPATPESVTAESGHEAPTTPGPPPHTTVPPAVGDRDPTGTPDPQPRASEPPAGPTSTDRDPAGEATTHPAAAATALLVARAWLTDVGPRLEVDTVRARADTYLEHGAVESVTAFGSHAVVTLSAVVLERDGDVYSRARARRLAVPIALGDPPRPAGEPWWLDEIDLAPSEPELADVDDPDVLLALGEAVGPLVPESAELVAAGRTTDGWWIVTVVTTDGDDEPRRVWLPPDLDPVSGAATTAEPTDAATADHDVADEHDVAEEQEQR